MADVQAAIAAGRRTRRRRMTLAAAIVVVGGAVATLSLMPAPAPRIPQVTSIRRVTFDGALKDFPYTDGRYVYYAAWGPAFASTALFRVPVGGGDSASIPTPFTKPYILDLSAAGELLLVDREVPPSRLYLMSAHGGPPRPVGTIQAAGADLSSDGRRLVFQRENRLFVADADGSNARELLAAKGSVIQPRWSPDGRRIRYTVTTPDTRTIWEATLDGAPPRVVLAGWFASCGAWTPDGRHFVFEAEHDGDYGLWALTDTPDGTAMAARPTKLTTGPLRFENAVPSPDGVTVLALGTPQPSAELVRFDLRTRAFIPLLGTIRASDVEFSRDGRSVVFVRYEDNTLWRSRADGTESVQLTQPPDAILLPRWSPDGRRIAFARRRPGGPWRSFVVAATGGIPTRVTAGDLDELDASWNPDGSKLVLSGEDAGTRRHRIHIVDLASGHREMLAGSEELFSPRWSPDGSLIAALSLQSDRLLVYDLSTKRWRELFRSRNVGWPSWDPRGRYVQVQRDGHVVRVHIADGRVEPLVDLTKARQAISTLIGASWVGMAHDGAPLILRQVGSASEYYALTVDWHD